MASSKQRLGFWGFINKFALNTSQHLPPKLCVNQINSIPATEKAVQPKSPVGWKTLPSGTRRRVSSAWSSWHSHTLPRTTWTV